MIDVRAPKKLLTVAGSDPSGGAGLQADLKTFGALGAYGMAAPTALTVQNTQGVRDILPLPAAFVAAQIEAIFDDIAVDAAKTGMLGSAGTVESVAALFAKRPALALVVDPVLASTSGHSLGGAEVAVAIMRALAPLAVLLTPNLGEAAALSGLPVARDVAAMEATGRALLDRGARAALVKGGHLEGDAVDVLCTRDGVTHVAARRVVTRNTHGTGCALSAAIATFLAQGAALPDAVRRAKDWLTAALEAGDALDVGRGAGPPDHFHGLRRA